MLTHGCPLTVNEELLVLFHDIQYSPHFVFSFLLPYLRGNYHNRVYGRKQMNDVYSREVLIIFTHRFLF